jgi:ferrous-iron efflux pump FieF
MTETSPQLTTESARAGRLMRQATYASVAVASTLIIAKMAAWAITDSVAMLSALIDSVLDALASIINLFAVRHALQPADREHRFGHGKAEALAGLAQAAFIAGSAAFLIIEAVQRFARPVAIENSGVGIAVSVYAIAATVVLVLYQTYVVRRTKSIAIAADSLHYKSDLALNASVIAALILSGTFGITYADPVFAIGIAAFVLFSAWRIFRRSYDELMDREFPQDVRNRIREIATAPVEVIDMHDLRTRSSGRDSFIQLHLELPSDISLMEAHHIADDVELRLTEAFPDAEVIIHQDPAGVDEDHPVFG